MPASGAAVPLARLSLEGQGVGPSFSEKDFQGVLYRHLDILSFSDVDAAYKTVVPLCRELHTPSGFEEAKNGETPVMVQRVVGDIDEIVRAVRFDGWQNTHAGEREVKQALRKTLFKYKLHQDAGLFERAYGYTKEYY